jgi:hypothetical protein
VNAQVVELVLAQGGVSENHRGQVMGGLVVQVGDDKRCLAGEACQRRVRRDALRDVPRREVYALVRAEEVVWLLPLKCKALGSSPGILDDLGKTSKYLGAQLSV